MNKEHKLWKLMLIEVKMKIKGDNDILLENEDIKQLSVEMNLDEGALKGYFGIDKSKEVTFPRVATRKIFADYLGYKDWNNYIKAKSNNLPIVIDMIEEEAKEPPLNLSNLIDESDYEKFFDLLDDAIENKDIVLTTKQRQFYNKFSDDFIDKKFIDDSSYNSRLKRWLKKVEKKQ